MRELPISVLFTIPNFITAGSGREMLQIVERLDRRRFAPAVCVLRKGGRLEEEARRMDLKVIEAPFSVPLRPFATLPARLASSARQLRPYRFALWHSFNWSSDFTEPLIARLAGADAWVYTKKNMGWDRRAWRIRTMLATAVMARNRDMQRRFFSKRPYRKATLVLGGVDANRFSPTGEGGFPPALDRVIGDRPLIVSVAQLVRVKGHESLINAVAAMDGVHLALAGAEVDQPYAGELRQLVDQRRVGDRVHFLGAVGDVRPLLARAHVFVLSTSARDAHEEGCPVALLEAMAAGKACIATDVAGSRDVIAHGQDGLLVPPDDAVALRSGLERLLADPAFQMSLGSAARQRVCNEFTLEREADQVMDLYERVLS
jgi:glycosyltransferase involved in cell wall biosynthesis